jgi:hypothetical protein
MNNFSKLATLALAASFCLQPAHAEQKVGDSTNVSLTIYNQNFGMVKDIRPIDLKAGMNDVRFEDVATQIDPTSVSFQSLTAPNSVLVREQNYQYDLLNPTTILSKSIGKQATFRQFIGNGQVNQITGILLNAPIATVTTDSYTTTQSQGLVIKSGDSVILNPEGQIELTTLPAGLISKPSLLWKIETDKPGTHKTEIAYQTQGLNWHCDYIAVANEDDSKVDLNSWVTLNNSSGASYKDASLKLVAGTPHLVPKAAPKARSDSNAAYSLSASSAGFAEESFAEYHLYKMNGKTDVNQNETKQISLFTASDIQATRTYVTKSQPVFWQMPEQDLFQPVQVTLEIKNSKANNLGMPLPQGKMRVYKKDLDGSLQFVGEDAIKHTPADETIRLQLGDVFDVVSERKQTNFLQISDHTTRLSWEIALRNHKDKPVTIFVVELGRGQWKILNSSNPFVKKDASTFEFKVPIPARGETKVTYQIEIKN